MKTTTIKTREEWLHTFALTHLVPIFGEQSKHLPAKFRVSVGFPHRSRGKTIGQCWNPSVSADEHAEIFISPVLGPFDAVDTLVHELVHAIVGTGHGHKGPFRKLALAVGLEGPMKSCGAGAALKARLLAALDEMPPWPGAQLSPAAMRKATKKPGSRLLKCECPDCGYVIRTTAVWIDTGLPTCPCGGEFKAA